MGKAKEIITRKIGPLPVWAWVAAGAVLLFVLARARGGGGGFVGQPSAGGNLGTLGGPRGGPREGGGGEGSAGGAGVVPGSGGGTIGTSPGASPPPSPITGGGIAAFDQAAFIRGLAFGPGSSAIAYTGTGFLPPFGGGRSGTGPVAVIPTSTTPSITKDPVTSPSGGAIVQPQTGGLTLYGAGDNPSPVATLTGAVGGFIDPGTGVFIPGSQFEGYTGQGQYVGATQPGGGPTPIGLVEPLVGSPGAGQVVESGPNFYSSADPGHTGTPTESIEPPSQRLN